MILERKLQYSKFLESLVEILDITTEQYEAAVSRYQAVGTWLSKENSSLAELNPIIYPQGSFQLGTVIKPISGEDEFDIDLVCQLEASTENYTQKEIKTLVGDRLKKNGKYKKMLDEEGRRCWTLTYAESTRFHMDILPSIPDDYRWLIQQEVPLDLAKHAISITDNEITNYNKVSSLWPKSNPKGYADWFKEQMKVVLQEKRLRYSEKFEMSIEEVKDYQVKTPLQRAIQLMKRHRDIMFGDDEDKPISIIITTLAAKSYYNQENLYDALVNIFDEMPTHIKTKTVDGKVVKWIENPVNPAENFADKWIEYPQREKFFYEWIVRAKADILTAIEENGINKIADKLKKPFGKKLVMEAVNKMGDNLRILREAGNLFMASGSGILGEKGDVKVQDHTFYGSQKQ